MTNLISLAGGGYRASLLPEAGGAIASLAWNHPQRGSVDLLRPAPVGAGKPHQCGCFPMLPFANRVRDSRFTFGGRAVQLPAAEIGRHFLHGVAWLRPWRVAEASASRVLLTFTHEPDAWPYAFETSTEFVAEADRVMIRMRARNRGPEPMPFGFGLHPYFPRTPLCRLKAGVTGWWETDADVLPTRHTAVPPWADPRASVALSPIRCDNAFTGWDGQAIITWPERATRLTMTASEPLRMLYLYVPAGEDYVCVEPASNLTDAFNLAAAGHEDTGLIVLQPGAEVSATVTLSAGSTA